MADPPTVLVPHLELAPHLIEGIPYPVRAFVPAFSTPLPDEVSARIARSLEKAVSLIGPAMRSWRMVRLAFGVPPQYTMWARTGWDIYVADLSQDPIATAGRDIVHFDAHRLAGLDEYPIDVAAVVILEELVHVWFNVLDETIARTVTAMLYGDITVRDGRYVPVGQALG